MRQKKIFIKGKSMALAYLLLIVALVLSFYVKHRLVYSILWVDFALIVWIFIHNITIHIGLNL